MTENRWNENLNEKGESKTIILFSKQFLISFSKNHSYEWKHKTRFEAKLTTPIIPVAFILTSDNKKNMFRLILISTLLSQERRRHFNSTRLKKWN